MKNSNKKNKQNNLFEPIFFSNSPEKDKEKDVFDFASQVKILHKVVDSDSKIIGIIGDYGSGKSSITEMFEKERKNYKKNKIIRINLWGNSKKSNPKNLNSVLKSFFYQLAYGNLEKNQNFSNYINYRFNKNQGRVSFKIATKSFFILLCIAALLMFVFYSLNSLDFSYFFNINTNIPPFETNKFLCVLYSLRYIFPVLAGGGIVWAIGIAAPVFSTWKSEGNYNIDNSDISDVYTLIMKRLLKGTKKIIVFIDDLDRISNYDTVIKFLKELYKCTNLLPKEQTKKIVFIVSLKPEEILQNVSNEKNEKIYPKIFDYTLNIKPIHCETYYDVVKDLLLQNIDQLQKQFNHYKKDLISSLLKDLSWLYNDENLTIREIKERLNETFLLYQTLRSRDHKSSSVELKKAAAVTFLKRKYPFIYNSIIADEKGFAELVRDCFRINDIETISKKVNTFINNKEQNEEQSENSKVIKALSKMLSEEIIEEDFALYFYNYPKHSYIKTLDEKELFDSLIHNNEEFTKIDRDNSRIQYIIRNKGGFVINEAFSKFHFTTIPTIVYKNEYLFRYVIEELPKQRTIIYEEFKKGCKVLSTDENAIFDLLSIVLNYSFFKLYRDELVRVTLSELQNFLIQLTKQSKNSVLVIRKQLITKLKSNISYYSPLFEDDNLPCIDAEEYQLLKQLNLHFSILQKMSDTKLNEFDNLFINFLNDKEVEKYLIERSLFKSVLFSYSCNNTLSEFDFSSVQKMKKIFEISGELFQQNQEEFIKIRTEILYQIQDRHIDIEYFQLFESPFPVITNEELNILDVKNLYFAIDFNRIDDNLLKLLIDYSKTKIENANGYYQFMNCLFLYDDDNKISKTENIKTIVDNIDYEKFNITELAEEKTAEIIDLLTPVYRLDVFSECLCFMKMVKHLILVLEQQVISPSLENDPSLLDNYIELMNELNECSDISIEILTKQHINCSLCPAVTDRLYENQYYISYLIGKSLYDKTIVIDKTISIENYYTAFILSDNFAVLFQDDCDLLNQFVSRNLYEKDLPDNRLHYFYKLRQPIRLTKFIMGRLKDNIEELKKYLYSITDFHEIEDASAFIDFITSSEYITLLTESNLFWYLWHKMWNKGQKGVFSKIVNRKLGTDYHSNDKEVN